MLPSTSGGEVVNPPEIHDQIERVTSSHAFRGSPSLCKLLSYLAAHALEHPGVSVKEYQVATEVFGRPAEFDPKEDSTVRVQAGRLRSKLAEYYSAEGADDTLIVDLPKGVYALEFHSRSATKPEQRRAVEVRSNSGLSEAVRPSSQWNTLSLALLVALAVSLGAAGYFFLASRNHQAAGSKPAAPEPLRTFWAAVLTSPRDPWVVFSNAAFVGRPDSGMRYLDSTKDRARLVLDHYTGVGEVLGIHDLDVALASLNRSARVKRGFLFTLDDARNNDLIFVGAPSENLTLLDIPSTREFAFRRLKQEPRSGNLEVVNLHPAAGEASEFLATPSNEPLTEDYSIIALVPGIDSAHSELILAGTTTIGTQAAVEFVTTPNHVQELLSRLGAKTPDQVKPFESVIRVKVSKGVPVESTIVAFRRL